MTVILLTPILGDDACPGPTVSFYVPCRLHGWVLGRSCQQQAE